jgi:hypothetical protein
MIMANRGYIYFLLNHAMPGLLKIGFTTRPLDQRMSQLHTSGVPQPFELGAVFSVFNPAACEAEIHKLLDRKRVNKGREFFLVDLATAIKIAHPIINQYLISTAIESQTLLERADHPSIAVDADDIYFMQFILHDTYEKKEPLSTEELATHHVKYHPLELERKLINLSEKGYVERVKYRNDIGSWWKITPHGVKFMFDNGHVLQNLIDDEKKYSKRTD